MNDDMEFDRTTVYCLIVGIVIMVPFLFLTFGSMYIKPYNDEYYHRFDHINTTVNFSFDDDDNKPSGYTQLSDKKRIKYCDDKEVDTSKSNYYLTFDTPEINIRTLSKNAKLLYKNYYGNQFVINDGGNIEIYEGDSKRLYDIGVKYDKDVELYTDATLEGIITKNGYYDLEKCKYTISGGILYKYDSKYDRLTYIDKDMKYLHINSLYDKSLEFTYKYKLPKVDYSITDYKMDSTTKITLYSKDKEYWYVYMNIPNTSDYEVVLASSNIKEYVDSKNGYLCAIDKSNTYYCVNNRGEKTGIVKNVDNIVATYKEYSVLSMSNKLYLYSASSRYALIDSNMPVKNINKNSIIFTSNVNNNLVLNFKNNKNNKIIEYNIDKFDYKVTKTIK